MKKIAIVVVLLGMVAVIFGSVFIGAAFFIVLSRPFPFTGCDEHGCC